MRFDYLFVRKFGKLFDFLWYNLLQKIYNFKFKKKCKKYNYMHHKKSPNPLNKEIKR